MEGQDGLMDDGSGQVHFACAGYPVFHRSRARAQLICADGLHAIPNSQITIQPETVFAQKSLAMSSLNEMRELLDELARVQVEAEFERGTFDIGRALKNLFRRHDSAEHRLLVLLDRTAEMGLDRSVIEQIAGRLPRRWTDPTAAAAPNEPTPRGEFVRPAARHQPPPSGGSEVEEAEHQPPPSGGSEVEAAAAPQLEGTSITERAKEWYDPEFFEALPPLTSHSCSLLTSTCINPCSPSSYAGPKGCRPTRPSCRGSPKLSYVR